jgi:hypothetical protein
MANKNDKKKAAQPHAGPINPKEPLVSRPVSEPGSGPTNPKEPLDEEAAGQLMQSHPATFHAVSAGPINPKEPL